MLLRNEPNPGREVTSRSEGPGVSNTRDQSGRQHRTDPGNVMKALARLVGPVPGHDHPIKLQDLLLEAEQLSAGARQREMRRSKKIKAAEPAPTANAAGLMVG